VVDKVQLGLLARQYEFSGVSVVGDLGLPKLLRIGSRLDAPLLGEVLDEALQQLPSAELERLQRRWLPEDTLATSRDLAFWRSSGVLLLLLVAGLLVLLLIQRRQQRDLERRLLAERRAAAERKAAEEALRMTQFAVDHGSVGILWVNWDGSIRYANHAAEGMLGYAPGGLNERPLSELQPELDMDRWLELWRRTRSDGGAAAMETFYRCSDGSWLPVELGLSFLRFGDSEYLVAFLSDVSERRRTQAALLERESRLQGIAANVPGMVFRLERPEEHLAPRFAFIGDGCEALLGYDSEALAARGVRSLVHPDDLSGYLETQARAFAENHDWRWQGRILTRDGALRWADIRASARRSSEDRAVWDGVLWDISENKVNELELEASRGQLRELAAHLESVREEEKARIAREVHDELGQVLTVLKLEISMCELAHGQVAGLGERMAGMKKLLAQLFSLVRDVASALRPPILDAGLASAIEWQALQFEARTGTPCLVSVPEHLPALSDARAVGLFRVLQEALTNVMRHARAHSVEVQLEYLDGTLCLQVADDGCGFDPAGLALGRSFGLVGMRERVLMLGGTLSIDSAPGEGATLVVRIALDKEKNA